MFSRVPAVDAFLIRVRSSNTPTMAVIMKADSTPPGIQFENRRARGVEQFLKHKSGT